MRQTRRPLPSQWILREILDYDPITGSLVWKERQAKHYATADPEKSARTFNEKRAGTSAYAAASQGYKQVSITIQPDKSFRHGLFLAHRIIWRLVHGDEPESLDHINGDRSDNRLSNLRDGSGAVNSRNMKIHPHNKSGFPGVYFCKKTNSWSAQIHLGTSFKRLGRYASFNEAIAARQAAEKVLGYHENHGRGGNQSNRVKVSCYSAKLVRAVRR